MNYHLIVDYRERALIDEFEKANTPVDVSNLDVGDIWIANKDNSGNVEPIIVIERKEIHDLASSIKSGRFHEQRARLIHTTSADVKVLFIIEKLLPYECQKIRNMNMGPVYSSLWSTIFDDKTSVFQTRNVYHTARCCEGIIKKLKKKKGIFWKSLVLSGVRTGKVGETAAAAAGVGTETAEIEGNTPICQVKQNYEAILCSKKKKNKTKGGISKEMLCCLSGISYTTAVDILEEFGSIGKIIQSITDGSYDERIMNVRTGKAKNRKLTKKVIRAIREQFSE